MFSIAVLQRANVQIDEAKVIGGLLTLWYLEGIFRISYELKCFA